MLRVSLLFVFAALGAAEVEEVSNQAQFQKILANNAAVAVDFYSTTCGPCIMIAPKYKEVRCKTPREPWREAAEWSAVLIPVLRAVPTSVDSSRRSMTARSSLSR